MGKSIKLDSKFETWLLRVTRACPSRPPRFPVVESPSFAEDIFDGDQGPVDDCTLKTFVLFVLPAVSYRADADTLVGRVET